MVQWGLTNQKLLELGAELDFCSGLPSLFEELMEISLNEEFKSYDFKVEHYIISTGLAQMIRGSKINGFVEKTYLHASLSNLLFLQIL